MRSCVDTINTQTSRKFQEVTRKNLEHMRVWYRQFMEKLFTRNVCMVVDGTPLMNISYLVMAFIKASYLLNGASKC